MAKKNFKLQKTNILPVDFTDRKGCGNDLVFYTTKGKVDFSRWMYIGIPKIEDVGNSKHADRNRLVFDLFNAIHQLSFESSKATIEVLAAEGCKQIFLFLDDLFLKGKTINSIDQFNRELIDQFLVWIRSKPAKTPSGRLSNSAARRHYTSIKTILLYFSRQGRISKEIFPYAPFVNVNKSGAGTEPYSKSEYSQIIKYLWQQLELIRCGKFEGTHRQKLAVYALAIAAKTGRNTSTILSLSKDCISPHPLAPDTQIILTGHKKRGMNTSVQAMKGSNNQEDIINANKSVEILIKEVIDHTSSIRSGREFAELFLITTDENIPSVFDDKYFWKAVQRIYERAELKNDSGGVLKIQVKRIRKTFAERIWQLTGGDPIKTAKMLGNTVPVMDKHYLDVTPEMEKNHKLFGHVLTETLLNQDGNLDSVVAKKLNISSTQANELLIGNFNTGVGRCSSPYQGKYSKNDGTACTRFVACFKCPNQVILEADLHRVFSFYWLLVKERNFIGRKKWKKLYSWVIKVIEKEIEPAFCPRTVSQAKQDAKTNPHPMWENRFVLDAL